MPGDTFIFGGEILALQGIVEDEALVVRVQSDTPKIPAWGGSKFPLSTYLASRVRSMLSEPHAWPELPLQVQDWLDIQAERSALPAPDAMLVETFPRGGRHYLVAYPFEGRLAHQTLGMLLTRRMERTRLKPLGFVGNDYALAVWMKADVGARLAERPRRSRRALRRGHAGRRPRSMARRIVADEAHFPRLRPHRRPDRKAAPGREKTGRQTTISTDLVYDVLRRHEPDHILLRAAREDAATGLLDLRRLGDLLSRIKGRIIHKGLDRISPLSVPIMLEIGREPVYGEAQDEILAEAADVLVEEAFGVESRAAAERV